MCGLVGMAGSLEFKHKAVMKDLLFLNALRGKDSTGLSVVGRDRGIVTRKMTVPGYEFIEVPMVNNVMEHGDQLWMGHGRWKTVGEVTRWNAHPFEVLDENGDVLLVGTHNGTLQNKWELEKELNNKRFSTDSEALFNWLVTAEDYQKAINLLRGAWSLVWWDPTTDSLHFCRNKERPLVYARSKDEKVLLWASEAWMLVNAARRNGMDLAQNDKGVSCFFTLSDYLYTLKIPQDKTKVLPELKREGGYTGFPVENFLETSQNKFQKFWNERSKPETAKGRSSDSEKEGAKVFHIGQPKGFEGKETDFATIAKLKEAGCAWCKDPIIEHQSFAYIAEDQLVCDNCLRDKHKKSDPVFDDDIPEFMQVS